MKRNEKASREEKMMGQVPLQRANAIERIGPSQMVEAAYSLGNVQNGIEVSDWWLE